MKTRKSFANSGAPETNGRTLTFLANSGKVMCDGLTVDLKTLKAPLIDGTLKLVSDLTESDKLSLPLLIDHMPSIECQAGAITRLWMTDAGLMAEAKLSEVDQGERIRQLAADGCLTNSFSITVEFNQRPGKDGIIHDGELLEISVVYRGADPRAAFTAINSRNNKNGDTMNQELLKKLARTIAQFKLTPDEAEQLTNSIADIMQGALDDITEAIGEQSESNNEENTPAPEEPVQTSNGRQTIIINKANHAAHQSGTVTFSHDRKTWLDSDDAMIAFERALIDTDNKGVEAFHREWADTVNRNMSDTASFDVNATDVTKFIPTEAITTISDALNTRGSGLWNLLRKTGLDRLTIGGNIAGLTEQTRAHGYPVTFYGTKKKGQMLSFVKRELQADYTYKYITLNKGDIRRTQRPGALLRYVLQELPNYIVQTIERQITLGGYTDMAHFRSVVTDAADTSSEWKGNRFALSYTMTDDTPLMDFVRASHMVRAQGNKVLLCNADTVADLLVSANANGNTYIALGGDDTLARALGVNQIITPEWWTDTDDTTTMGVIMSASHYAVVGDTSIEAFTNFALSTNTNEYLQEIYAGGGLDAEKSAVVIKPKGE
ncbi:MAG: major capsid protein [Moriyavirus koyama]|uniref:Major capsid protein n=1 Tax=Bacteriophage sp. TaxID=38018 RepID=A0ABY5TS53_9VIRU|nr:MAG: major capsid protein [Bacteriophage sp.]